MVAVGFAIYQQYLIRGRDPGQSFRAFLNNNWFGAAVFAGIAADYLFH
jgi:4-hydroxybenzoate polyprenyltransferase